VAVAGGEKKSRGSHFYQKNEERHQRGIRGSKGGTVNREGGVPITRNRRGKYFKMDVQKKRGRAGV